jgi:type I restriction enzyme M protein
MNIDTKRHIDSARQVLVGVVPNPTSQIEQITNALIYKFMDDMDQSAIKVGGKPSFFTGDLEKYSWTRLMDSRVTNQERVNMYSEALIKFSQAKQLPPLFRNIFKSAFLSYRSPEVLGLFLKEINYFDYSHPEELGNAYEYLLSIMGSQGDAGQFRTPRHIIDFMVELVNPTKDDKVLDPACGTGGFLISAYKNILKQHDGKNADGSKNGEKPLTPDQRKKLIENFEGYDIDPGMVRIAQVNMYLHQFKDPKIYNYDTLTMEDRWNDKFDVMLANPPFMSPKGGVNTHSKFSIQSNRSEVLFVDYIMNHLRPKGRAGIIVPEGIIFQSATAHKKLRENLVKDGLCAVISLPSGVFNPYAGVKTSILIFDNEVAKQKTEILFLKIENDGFDLGAQRRPANGSNLPEAVEIFNKWKSGKKIENKIALYVERKKILETEDFNLSGDRYKEVKDYSNAKWSMIKIRELCNITTGKKDANQGNPDGEYPFFTCAKENLFIDSYSFDTEALLIAGNGDVGAIKYYKGKFDAYQRTYVLDGFKKVKARYLYQVLNNSLKESLQLQKLGNTMPYIKLGMLQNFEIPLPPLEIQEQIVNELDGYQKIIDGSKQIFENWKPKIDIDTNWKWSKIEDVATEGKNSIKAGPFGSSVKKEIYVKDGYKVYGQEQVIKGDINYGNYYIDKQTYKSLESCSIKAGDILISLVGTYGKLLVVPEIFKPGIINPRLMKITLNKDKCLPDYFQIIFENGDIKNQVNNMSYGGTMGILNTTILRELKIPIPPIKIQKQIIEKIQKEKELVESSKKLIEIYEQKIKEVINKLWEE